MFLFFSSKICFQIILATNFSYTLVQHFFVSVFFYITFSWVFQFIKQLISYCDNCNCHSDLSTTLNSVCFACTKMVMLEWIFKKHLKKKKVASLSVKGKQTSEPKNLFTNISRYVLWKTMPNVRVKVYFILFLCFFSFIFFLTSVFFYSAFFFFSDNCWLRLLIKNSIYTEQTRKVQNYYWKIILNKFPLLYSLRQKITFVRKFIQ